MRRVEYCVHDCVASRVPLPPTMRVERNAPSLHREQHCQTYIRPHLFIPGGESKATACLSVSLYKQATNKATIKQTTFLTFFVVVFCL